MELEEVIASLLSNEIKKKKKSQTSTRPRTNGS